VIWPQTFEDRLVRWNQLRTQAAETSLPEALMLVNDWWWHAPMVNRSLSWRDYPYWPGPWELLSQPAVCDLARCLGMLYTVLLVDNLDITDMDLVQTEDNNLVLINSGLYILNWSPGEILNIQSPETLMITKRISSEVFKKNIG